MDLWTELFAEDAANHFPFHSSFLGGLNIFGRDEVLAAWSGYLQDFEGVSLPVDAIAQGGISRAAGRGWDQRPDGRRALPVPAVGRHAPTCGDCRGLGP